MLGHEVHGATVGIIGMGRIGRLVARRALGFDMTVRYHNRHRRPEVEQELGVRYGPFDDVLAESDYLVDGPPDRHDPRADQRLDPGG